MIKDLLDYILNFGDTEIKVNLLTENQSNYITITGNAMNENSYDIECEINNINEFIKKLKYIPRHVLKLERRYK